MKTYVKLTALLVVALLGLVPFALAWLLGFLWLALRFGYVCGHDEVYKWLKAVRFN